MVLILMRFCVVNKVLMHESALGMCREHSSLSLFYGFGKDETRGRERGGCWRDVELGFVEAAWQPGGPDGPKIN
jgi:hypothetical protein